MMTLNAMILALSLNSAPGADDLSWMAGYWLDCSNGREVSETWSDPRGGLIVGHNVTMRGGRAGSRCRTSGRWRAAAWPISPSRTGRRRRRSA